MEHLDNNSLRHRKGSFSPVRVKRKQERRLLRKYNSFALEPLKAMQRPAIFCTESTTFTQSTQRDKDNLSRARRILYTNYLHKRRRYLKRWASDAARDFFPRKSLTRLISGVNKFTVNVFTRLH